MKRALITTLTGLLLAAPLGLAVAPPAAAECLAIDGCIEDGTKTTSPKPPPPQKDPVPDGCEALGNCPEPSTKVSQTWTETTRWGGAKYFWQGGTVPLTTPFAHADYSALYGLAGCGPQKGYADAPYGTTYNIRAGFWVVDTTEYYYVLRSENGQVDTIEGATVRTFETQCTTYTVPSPQPYELTSVGRLTINGPYDFDGSPMTVDGGSLTRDSFGNGTPSVQGKSKWGESILGAAIRARTGGNIESLTTELPTPREAYENGMTGQDLGYRVNEPEKLEDHGRYYAVSERWRPVAHVVQYTSFIDYLGEMFPSVVAQNGTNFFYTNRSYYPMYFDDITGPVKRDDLQRFRIYCFAIDTNTNYSAGGFRYEPVTGPQPSSFAGLKDALPSMPSAARTGSWNDNENTYTYECGPPPPPEKTREQDYLQCDTYDIYKEEPRTTRAITYTTHTGTRWAHIGWNWYWGCSCGGTCGRWSNGDPYCRTARWGWENYSYQTEDPVPPGYTKTGSPAVWLQDCPTGWTAEPTKCTSLTVSGRIVDQKNAAPIDTTLDSRIGMDALQEAEVTGETEETLTISEPATGDHLFAEWRRPRINVNFGPNKGKDITTLPGGDVTWERRYSLKANSSPVLKSGSVNATNQPYHLWTDPDTDPTTQRPEGDELWVAASDNGTDDAALNKWVGDKAPSGWEDTQRALWMRWLMSSTAGSEGWTVTPYWRATVTLKDVEFDKVIGFEVANDGTIIPITQKVTEDRRESYVCPGQRLNVNVTRTVS